jgi:hypothetical protein
MSHWEKPGVTNEWYTPKYIFSALGEHFDVDVASPASGPAHVPCSVWISEGSLEKEWAGFVWMNPPFGGLNGTVPWLDKFFAHGNGIALVPDRTSARWFQKYVPKSTLLLFVSPRVKFERPDGTQGGPSGPGTVLLSAGKRAEAALIRASSLGLLMRPTK